MTVSRLIVSAICPTIVCKTASRPTAVVRSRLSEYRVEVRASRWRSASTWSRTREVKLLMISPTTSRAINVRMYWVSDTVKVSFGWTKKKSKARTLRKEASMDGPLPQYSAATTTAAR